MNLKYTLTPCFNIKSEFKCFIVAKATVFVFFKATWYSLVIDSIVILSDVDPHPSWEKWLKSFAKEFKMQCKGVKQISWTKFSTWFSRTKMGNDTLQVKDDHTFQFTVNPGWIKGNSLIWCKCEILLKCLNILTI